MIAMMKYMMSSSHLQYVYMSIIYDSFPQKTCEWVFSKVSMLQVSIHLENSLFNKPHNADVECQEVYATCSFSTENKAYCICWLDSGTSRNQVYFMIMQILMLLIHQKFDNSPLLPASFLKVSTFFSRYSKMCVPWVSLTSVFF